MNIKNVFVFVAGAGVGALITYKLVKDKYEEILEEEIESVKEVFGRNRTFNGEIVEMSDEEYEESVNNIVKENQFNEKTEKLVYKRKLGKVIDYDKKFKSSTLERAKDNRPKEDDSEPKEEPYVISVAEFNDEMVNHDKLTITYYELDETLTDEREEILTDIDSIVGSESLLCFGEESNDPDIVYVRNESLGADYEVIRVPKSYQETILGIMQPPKRRGRPKANAEE